VISLTAGHCLNVGISQSKKNYFSVCIVSFQGCALRQWESESARIVTLSMCRPKEGNLSNKMVDLCEYLVWAPLNLSLNCDAMWFGGVTSVPE
jgi:hypothetical protein